MIATYRIQLHREFGFQDTFNILEYLKRLGISHVYLSPILSSAKESVHGYDGVDFKTISEERGGEKALESLLNEANRLNLKILIDIVPNHMAATEQNPYWMDVLKNGQKSKYWDLFDLRLEKDGKIHLPVLGEEPEAIISQDGFKIEDSHILYGDKKFPLREDTKLNNSLEDILEFQYYRLTIWRDVAKSLGYRRFFDVTSLIGVRVENPKIYAMSHEKIFSLLENFPCIDGVRVDHVDGLTDPTTYLSNLSKNVKNIWVEKILAREEALLEEWPVHGATGYEFVDFSNLVFVRKDGFLKIEKWWKENIETEWYDFSSAVYDAKSQVLKMLFPAEISRLSRLIARDTYEMDEASEFWLNATLNLHVYRTYMSDNFEDIEKYLAQYDVKGKFLPRLKDSHQAVIEWQQVTGPAMAKGLEDTAHYRYVPLSALNEVGCEPVPQEIDSSKAAIWFSNYRKKHTYALNATSTHDTKRSEDCRARLFVLSEIPTEWISFCENMRLLNGNFKDKSFEYFIYQQIIAAWGSSPEPEFTERIKNNAVKAMRETKRNTSWLDPDNAYEDHVLSFIERILSDKSFILAVEEFSRRVNLCGAGNSLSMLALKILTPGVPDIYQGCESWSFSLVDPDNRRPVNYNMQESLLNSSFETELNDMISKWSSGLIKVWFTKKLLEIRRKITREDSLSFVPCDISGEKKDNIIAWIARGSSGSVLVLMPRYYNTLFPKNASSISILPEVWMDTKIHFHNETTLSCVISGLKAAGKKEYPLSEILRGFPVGIYELN